MLASLRHSPWFLFTLGVGLLSTLASADDVVLADQSAGESPANARRVRVELAVWGPLSDPDRATLVGLLRTELEGRAFVLVPAPLPLGQERLLVSATADPLTLMRVVVDARAASGWRILIVDAARGRLLVREQAGQSRNAAALEATVSIIAAAAAALGEGFEIAAMVATAAPAPSARARPSEAPRQPPQVQVLAAAGASMASFVADAPVHVGLAGSLGVRFFDVASLRLGVAHFGKERFASRFGDFELQRIRLALTSGVLWCGRRFEGELALGPALELLSRGGTVPAPGVAAPAGSSIVRVGGEAQLRARYRVLGALAVEAMVGAGYFPSPVRFVADVEQDSVLVEPFRLVGLGGLTLELRLP